MRETQYICKHCQHRLDEDCGGKGGGEGGARLAEQEDDVQVEWWSGGPYHLSEDDDIARGVPSLSVIHRDLIIARIETRAHSDVASFPSL